MGSIRTKGILHGPITSNSRSLLPAFQVLICLLLLFTRRDLVDMSGRINLPTTSRTEHPQ